MIDIRQITSVLHGRRGQILLPAVMIGPLFILLIYLLFEMSKLSMTKVRQQFALDSSAYSQMSTTSGYLNALAQVNGPLPYRVMKTMNTVIDPKPGAKDTINNLTVFDMFYRSGAFPAIGPDYTTLGTTGVMSASAPKPESTNWQFNYYPGTRDAWLKDEPKELGLKEGVLEEKDGEKYHVLTNKTLAENYFFRSDASGLPAIKEYFTIFVRTGSIYQSQKFVYDDTVKNSRMFRESYFLNTKDCRPGECGQEAARVLNRYILDSKPMEIKRGRFYIRVGNYDSVYPLDLNIEETLKIPLFQFAYLTSSSRSKLRQLARGVRLKQKYTVPANRFNINLTQKYKPVVQNSVSVSCPRGGNNCVWPNPLPKYSVKVGL